MFKLLNTYFFNNNYSNSFTFNFAFFNLRSLINQNCTTYQNTGMAFDKKAPDIVAVCSLWSFLYMLLVYSGLYLLSFILVYYFNLAIFEDFVMSFVYGEYVIYITLTFYKLRITLLLCFFTSFVLIIIILLDLFNQKQILKYFNKNMLEDINFFNSDLNICFLDKPLLVYFYSDLYNNPNLIKINENMDTWLFSQTYGLYIYTICDNLYNFTKEIVKSLVTLYFLSFILTFIYFYYPKLTGVHLDRAEVFIIMKTFYLSIILFLGGYVLYYYILHWGSLWKIVENYTICDKVCFFLFVVHNQLFIGFLLYIFIYSLIKCLFLIPVYKMLFFWLASHLSSLWFLFVFITIISVLYFLQLIVFILLRFFNSFIIFSWIFVFNPLFMLYHTLVVFFYTYYPVIIIFLVILLCI